METAMTRFTLLLFVALLCGADRSTAQEKVEARGITSEVKLDEVTFGHLTELNLPREPTLECITMLAPGSDIFSLAS